MTTQIYVFTNTPLKCERKCKKKLAKLKAEYGIFYTIITNFKQFRSVFQANAFTRVEFGKWKAESHAKSVITPTVTMKAFIPTSPGEEIPDDLSIMKLSVAPKFMHCVSQMARHKRKYVQLNGCDEVLAEKNPIFDYWPIPDEVQSVKDDIPIRESIPII